MHIGLFVKDFAIGKKFSKDGLPTKSGAEFHAENHAKQLIARGHTVTIMAKKRHWFTKARENLGGIDLVRLHDPIRWLEILIRLITTHRSIDAFYIIGTPKFAVWAVLYAKFTGRPVTLALTGKAEIFDAKANWRNKILAQCTNYIATTHEIQRGFIVEGGIAAEKISVLAHGIDTKRYPLLSVEKRVALRAVHYLGPDTKILLFCARVVINKGIDTVQTLWTTIHKQYPDACLFVVGGGKTELLEGLRTLSKSMDDSIIVTGEVEQPQEYYQMADVYIFPSRHEGLPTSLLEAMSSGLPTVASDIGGCDDLIFDGETGYRVYSEDAAAFAERISYLFAHPKEAQQMGKNAAAYVRAHCDYSQVIWKLEEIMARNK